MAEPRDQEISSGLDYLERAGRIGPSKMAPTRQGPPAEDVGSSSGGPGIEAFAARAFLDSIREIEVGRGGVHPGARLSETSTKIGMSGKLPIPLARRLEGLGLVRTLEYDSFGDHLVTITDAADKILESPDPIGGLISILS